MVIVFKKERPHHEVTTHPKALRARLTTFGGRSPALPLILIGGKIRKRIWNLQEFGSKIYVNFT